MGFGFGQIGDGPVVKKHVSQSDIEAGNMGLPEIFSAGHDLFNAKFNMFDGQGRPGTTGGGAARTPGSAPLFIRTSAPDSNSCGGCHNDPFSGGAGDIVANVFVLAQVLDPVTESISADFSDFRNTLGMQGSGPIEMLAREMTADLQAIKDMTLAEATTSGSTVTHDLVTKGVHFGSITAHADGSVDSSAVDGVDKDLIIKPFHQKGAVISLREFTNNAMNHHHGIQSVERFGVDRTGTHDFDQDGVEDEFTVGDVSATTIYQAALNVPGQVIPRDPVFEKAIINGEETFKAIGCDGCHVAELTLNDPVFTEPNPYNKAGDLQVSQVSHLFSFDLRSEGQMPRLESKGTGAVVRAFTDLKRHNLCDDELQHFCNEKVVQAGIPTEEFLTRKLWDVGNSAPYGHVGDLTTITEAIYFHGGEARSTRDAFFALSQHEQDEVVEFLKSLQMLPPDTASLIVDENMQPRSKPSRRNLPDFKN